MNYNESDEINPYESKTNELFVSTIDDPLKFFKAYLKSGGEDYLKLRFESYKERDGEHDKEKGLIYIQKCLPPGIQRGELLDEETNCREYNLTFDEYFREELTRQAKLTSALIQEKRRTNGDDQDLKLYKTVLNECVDIHKEIMARVKLNFGIELGFLIHALYKMAFDLFEKDHPKIPASIFAKRYFQKQKDPNITGFKLKPHIWFLRRKDFYDGLIKYSYIANRDVKSLDEFFRGEKPVAKINWIKKLNELKYFINRICNKEILEKVPGQQWKYLGEIFTCNGEELPLDWNRKRNYLKDKKKKTSIDRLTNMLHAK